MAKLRTGTEYPDALVTSIYLNLERVLEIDPIAFYEVVELARDPHHDLWGDTQILQDHALVQVDGTMLNAVRDVVLASVAGDEENLRLVSPY